MKQGEWVFTDKPYPPELTERAACKGKPIDWWFPPRGKSGGRHIMPKGTVYAEAVAICNRCPVQDVCLEYSLADPFTKDGIWGGLSGRGRQRFRSQRRIAA